MGKPKGLYANIHAKRKRIASGSGEKMRKPGTKGAPKAKNFKQSLIDEEIKKIKKIMETCVTMSVPSKVDCEIGPNWGKTELKQVNDK